MRLFTFFSVLLFASLQVIAQEATHPPINTNNNNNVVIITNANYNDTCLGALIHPFWVVTSGICAIKTIDQDTRIFFSHTPPIFDYGTFISNIHIHPNFNEEPLNNDVGLIKLATPADRSIRTLKIPNKYLHQDLSAKKAFSFGQYTGYNSLSVLKISRVVILNEELCARYPVSISDSRFCGYPAVGCEGDEGGPLILDNLLIGVTSISPLQAALCNYSEGCNSLIPVTTFTKLESHRQWIINVTGLSII